MGRCLEGGRLTGSNSDETDARVSWDLTISPLGSLNLHCFCKVPYTHPGSLSFAASHSICLHTQEQRVKRWAVWLPLKGWEERMSVCLVCKAADFRVTCYLDLKEHEPALGHFVPNRLFSPPVVANTLSHSTALWSTCLKHEGKAEEEENPWSLILKTKKLLLGD